MAIEFVAALADLFSVERVAPAAADFLVLAAALLLVEFSVFSALFPPVGVALAAAAELLVDVLAVLLFFSFLRMEIGLRAFVIAFDRS